jgi:hypothetical protein
VKLVGLVAVPAGVLTVMRPVAAPAGTVVTIWVAVADTMAAGVPPNATAVAAGRFWPVMVTVVPAAPEAGVKPAIFGVTAVVIRPIALPPRLVTVPVVVIRPIELSPLLVNHSAPSGPAVIPNGWSMPVPV